MGTTAVSTVAGSSGSLRLKRPPLRLGNGERGFHEAIGDSDRTAEIWI
jgi:hypothetical protein